jgi:nucleotide-binding universal stress UspA family protein
MEKSTFTDMPFVNSILHPSDFTMASENAFAHALAIALLRHTRLTILHVDDSADAWTKFPAVRTTLERWKLMQKGSPRSAVFDELQLRVEKISLKSKNPLKAITDFLQEHPRDLVILATHDKEGLPRWIKPSVAEKIAEKSKTLTLFIPGTEGGFVRMDNGKFYLKRILIPIDRSPSPLPAMEYAVRAANLVENKVEIILFHAGEASQVPAVQPPQNPGCTWRKVNQAGNPVEEITNTARKNAVDLIVMSTAGHNGFLDVLRGSVTEQVLRSVPCPLLAVPVV